MKMFLQQGYGMMALNREFAERYDDLGFILSPRSLQSGQSPERLKEHAKEVKKLGGKILFDPQFYQPRTNLDKILKFPYFDNLNYETVSFNGEEAKQFSRNVIKFQKEQLQVDEFIIPGTYSNTLNENWVQLQEDLMDGGLTADIDGVFYQTISIGSDIVLNDNFGDFIAQLVLSKVDGYYITLKKPTDEYSTSNTIYLYNLLDAFLSLKLAGKKLILGYANPQDLMFTSVGLDVIASGNYQNVRSFKPEIFFEDNESTKRKGKWYYDNNTLSEYKPEQLALAQSRGLIEMFKPVNDYNRDFLESNQMSTFLWREGDNFKNYLYNIYQNCVDINSALQRFEYVEQLFVDKEKNENNLLENGFRIGARTFNPDSFEATLSALSAIKNDRLEDILELQSRD